MDSGRRRPAQAPSFLTAWVRRETLREAVLEGSTPFRAAPMISGSALARAAVALALSPAAMASSTFRTKVRMRERRALLTCVRAAILRTAFLADFVLAMGPACWVD